MANIFEGLFILALDDEEGDFIELTVNILDSVLAGAVLAEMVMQNRVELVDNRVVVTNQIPTDHPILDKFLFEILDTSKARKLKYWINTLIHKKILDEIGHQLVENGALVRKKKRLHQVSNNGKNINGFGSAKYSLLNRLREIVLAGQSPEPAEKVLLAFLYHAELLKLISTPGERKIIHKRVKKLVANEEESSGLGEALDQIVAEACESNR